MKTSPDSRARRGRIALIVSGVILVALIAVGGYGLLFGSHNAPPSAPPASSPPAPVAPSPPDASRPDVPRILPTNDPELFAHRVATALFTWDTGAGLVPLDYTSAILEVGDPSGYEQAGLASDIASYLPTREAWVKLREYATTQRIDIDTVVVPDSWADAAAQARPGQLPPGAIAYTVDGTRHRDGMWNGTAETLSVPVAFTLFMACPPDGDPCYLLRLSQLENPLR